MKKIGLVFSLILFFSVTFQLSAQWFFQSPGPTSNMLNDILFVDSLSGWIAGEDGILMHTTNGGVTWNNQITAFYYKSIKSIDFISKTTGWAVGLWGRLYKTTNKGQNWLLKNSNTDKWLFDVDFISETNGIVVGGSAYGYDPGIILKTTDGGETWTNQLSSAKHLYSVDFVSDSIVFAVGDEGEIWKSIDGGSEWFLVPSNTTDNLRSVYFINDNIGWIIEAEYTDNLLRTTDGGNTWVVQGIGEYSELYSIKFISDQIGWASGILGNLFKTYDGGVTWIKSYVTYSLTLSALCFLSENSGYMVCSNGAVLHTTDGGINWGGLKIVEGLCARFASKTNGIIGSENKLFRTTDGGDTWYSSYYNGDFKSIYFLNDSLGWAVCNPNGYVYRTTNGGLSWSRLPARVGAPYSIFFISDSIGWTVGYNQQIRKTTDGGLNWVVQGDPNIFYGCLFSVFFTSETTGYAVGDDALQGGFYYTTNGGNNWQSKIISGCQLYSVFFISKEIGWTAGNCGSILKTTDSGNHWTAQSSNTGNAINSIYFVDENNGWAVGTSGTILYTTNGGNNWNLHPTITKNHLKMVQFVDTGTGWIFGENGSILKTTNGGITFIEEDNNFTQPKDFLLKQNYPNPFNPSTKISWQSPVSGWQTLKIYDILGNEIATLVNEEKNAGSYEVEFQSTVGSHLLANGVYFYQLRVGDFVETKKMVLLK